MRRLHLYKIRLSTILCLFLITAAASAQTYRFRTYGAASNLPSQVIYTIDQDNDRYLWIGTTEGLFRFDGYEFFKVQFPDSSSGRYPTVTMKDSKGKLWFGCNDGTLYYTSGKTISQVDLPGSSGSGIMSIIEHKDGNLYVIPQRKPVYKISTSNNNDAVIIELNEDPNMFSAALTSRGDILIGTQENILICSLKSDSLSVRNRVEGFDYSMITSILRTGETDNFIIGTDGNGLFHLKLEGEVTNLSRFAGYSQLQSLSVKTIMRDSRNNIWISTRGKGVIKLQQNDATDSLVSVQVLDKTSGLAGDNVLTVFEDAEENIWMGFNGEGLSILATDAFEFLTPGKNDQQNNIIYTRKLEEHYLLGTPSGFYIYDLKNSRTVSFSSVPVQSGRKEISTYFIDNDDNIWIGTKGSGLFIAKKTGEISQFYRSGDTGADYINSISINGDFIWLATLNGVQIISKQSKSLVKSYNINNGLPHNSINQILIDKNGTGYIATESDRLFRINPDSGIFDTGAVIYGMLLNKVIAMTIDKDGYIWAATAGNGVFQCFADSVRQFTTANGLLSNYTYSILADSENDIWIGHEQGISMYNQKTGIIKVYSNDFARNGSCNSNGIYENPDGMIFIGTTQGLIIYDRTKDMKSRNAPVNNINFISINNIEYKYQPVITLPYKKRYNIRIGFTGINLSDPSKVFYSTFLENFEDEWTKASGSREVNYNLRDGKYKFNLISINEDGLSQENPLSIEIIIKRPVWRSWWFIISMLGVLTIIVILIIREREKAQKKVQEYLEKELDARTRVVVQQKSELELQNLEITDSINYAKRIQSSILPDLKRISEHFKEAFIMLYPRDIVSGDFYWFDKINDDTLILVCADSTGHGVPGAFMSMIGSTLLQDIVTRQRISKPSEILTILDKQIFSTLNQNLELGVSNDGMDIVVCEFTLKNRHLRFASAMRPVLLVMGGEQYYIKGNRASVGGQAVMEKYFDDQEYYLNEGDMVYLFTDGLPDQFGGPEGKKMKIARLRKLIEEITSLSSDEQKKSLEKFYLEWKGDFNQVDDILFMGIRV